MKRDRAIRRRRFLQVIGAAAATAGCSPSSRIFGFFSATEARTLAALCDQIIPPDEAPGAAQAGAVHFIDKQLHRHFRKHRKVYREGIAALDRYCRERRGKSLVELAGDEQARLLLEYEQGPGRDFFYLVIDHTMMGYYGDPRHGGNRDQASWRMLGLPNPPVRGRLHYELPGNG
jgi:gluconate 2-dehydrogenase gamma chain